MSKHLLATSMRLMEVGTKQQSLGKDEEAYKMFNSAYDMYCLFWGLNMGMMETKDLKWIEPDIEEVKKISAKASEVLQSTKSAEVAELPANEPADDGSALSKMKRIYIPFAYPLFTASYRLVVFLVVCYSLFCFLLLLFSSAILRAKGAESIVYLTYIYRISIVFDSGLCRGICVCCKMPRKHIRSVLPSVHRLFVSAKIILWVGVTKKPKDLIFFLQSMNRQCWTEL